MSLSGATILVTRSPGQAESMARLIEERGGIPVMFPAIAIGPPPSWHACDEALARLASFDAAVFPSVNAVGGFFQRCRDRRVDADVLRGLPLYAVGPATRQAIERLTFTVRGIPREFTAAGLVSLLLGESLRRVLLPRGTRGRAELVDGLRDGGVDVEAVPVYDIAPSTGDPAVRDRLVAGEIDVLTFASPSAVEGVAAALEPVTLASIRTNTAIAVIGPTTLEAVRSAGADADIVPSEYTIPSMIDAIEHYFERLTHE